MDKVNLLNEIEMIYNKYGTYTYYSNRIININLNYYVKWY